jgi:hypothetical protein
MAVGFPTKVDYNTGDVLSAQNMNDLSGTVNLLESAQYAAGKNKIINGDFGIWQRGTTLTTPAGSTYLADRWLIGYDGTAPTASVYDQQTFTLGTAPVAGYESNYFARTTVTTKGSNTRTGLAQRVESVRTFAGQTVTFSFYAKADTTRTGAIQVIQSFGSGGSANVTVVDSAISLTDSWQRFTATISIPSIAGKTIGAGDYLTFIVYHNSANGSYLDLWGAQAEAGSTASPFQTATGTIQGELAACQRYYQSIQGSMATGVLSSSTAGYVTYNMPVVMRTTPTPTIPAGPYTNYIDQSGTSFRTPTSITSYSTTTQTVVLSASGMSGGTTGAFIFLVGGFYPLSSEL